MLVVALLGAFVMVHGASTRQGVSSTRPAASATQPASGSAHSRLIQAWTLDEPVTIAHPDLPALFAGTVFSPEVVASDTDARAGSPAVVTAETAVPSDRAPPVA